MIIGYLTMLLVAQTALLRMKMIKLKLNSMA
jgi:hypothetical protein